MTTQVAPNPQRIMQYAFGFVPSLAVASAIELGLFGAIEQGHATLARLAQACNCSERGLMPLLHTLVSLELLQSDPEGWSLAPDARLFLVPSSPAYLGGMLTHQTAQIARWTALPETIRQGRRQVEAVEGDQDNGKFFAGFVDSLFNLNFPAAQAVAAQLGEAQSALDIGCGSGVWSLALALLHPQLKVIAVDRALVLDQVTRPFAQRMGCLDRYEMRAGNFRDVDFGSHDVVFLGHILHSEGESASRTLLQRCHRALNPGGRLVVAEMVASEPRGAHLFPNLFDLNMLMWTEEGTVFTASQLEEMCGQAGFTRCQWLSAPSPSPILVAQRD